MKEVKVILYKWIDCDLKKRNIKVKEHDVIMLKENDLIHFNNDWNYRPLNDDFEYFENNICILTTNDQIQWNQSLNEIIVKDYLHTYNTEVIKLVELPGIGSDGISILQDIVKIINDLLSHADYETYHSYIENVLDVFSFYYEFEQCLMKTLKETSKYKISVFINTIRKKDCHQINTFMGYINIKDIKFANDLLLFMGYEFDFERNLYILNNKIKLNRDIIQIEYISNSDNHTY